MKKPTDIDFSNPVEIRQYLALLVEAFNKEGMLVSGVLTKDKVSHRLHPLQVTARQFLGKIDEALPKLSVAGALAVAESYDLVHRLATGRSCDARQINPYVLRALSARIHGDKKVDVHILFNMIGRGLRHRDRDYIGLPLDWYSRTLSRWHSLIKRRICSGVPKAGSRADAQAAPVDRETILTIKALLDTDLSIYEGKNEPAFKRTLLHTLNVI